MFYLLWRLVKSKKTGVFCIKCDGLIPVDTSRFIEGDMHYHFNCTDEEDDQGTFIEWVLDRIK